MMLTALLLAAASPERTFGDWAVACDNVHQCQAVSLMAPSQLGDDVARMTLTRAPGPAGGVTLAIDADETVAGRVSVVIDGRVIAPGLLTHQGYRETGAAAEGIARTMAKGSWLELRLDRKTVARISLKGSAAMMRWIDAEQGRDGGITALVARGPNTAVMVPPAQSLPAMPAIRPPKGKPERPGAALLDRLRRETQCDEEDNPPAAAVETFRLDAKATLLLLPCGSGAYNFNSMAFILRSGRAEPAGFDVAPDQAPGNGPFVITNGSWEGGTLDHYEKGRGLGDCGIAQRWVWDGTRFRQIEARWLEECRGAIDWPVTYRATPAWR